MSVQHHDVYAMTRRARIDAIEATDKNLKAPLGRDVADLTTKALTNATWASRRSVTLAIQAAINEEPAV